ncbi:histidine kinase [Roseisolibacter sp. H3M3-2]|uniref:sensor histidine kinase n=1 Tax=Roseisolibacter sp. H3M3-2 TaxID=3031323 RepID=UPI0023DB5A55|nr:histidine kinase [Roseisolibacter sp. H3M3-2]MDF1501578.1 histidine kinase [Roseisolibacter sp. H3M3-2]
MSSFLPNPASRFQADPVVWSHDEIVSAVTGLSTGLATAVLVVLFVRRFPWPRPFGTRFVVMHVVGALGAAAVWLTASGTAQALLGGRPFLAHLRQNGEMVLVMGSVFYAILAGVTHAVDASARAARAEALAARTQLAALRAQLHPHFLFNALHAVVQLIPVEPARAAEAAELVADLLRTTLEEQRDEVTLADEWRFVSRYLAVERMRFGDRLAVHADLAPALLDARVPAFALQTLVENAVLHGAAPRVAATEIVVTATGDASELRLAVRNSGDGAADAPATPARSGAGTGLARLRERLSVLYGSAARLASGPLEDGGFESVLVVPRRRGAAA